MNYKMVKGHFILDFDGKKLMLDTGAPISLGQGQIAINAKQFQLIRSVMGQDVEGLLEKSSEFVGEQFHGFLGNDIIGEFDLVINEKNKTIEFVKENRTYEGIKIDFDILPMTASPVIKIKIEGKEVKAVLDTGARVCFAKREFFKGKTKTRTEQEFNPMIGPFDADIYSLETDISGIKGKLEFGTLPSMAEGIFAQIGCSVFIGSEFFANKTVVISVRQKALWVKI